MQSSYLQTKQWASFKSGFGWQSDNAGDIYVLSRQLPYINQTMSYVPELYIDEINVIDTLATFAKTKKTMFLRLEILNRVDDENVENIKQKLKENGFIKAFEELQPEHRQIIDLTQSDLSGEAVARSEDDLLVNMKEKGRYNTRLAQKKGVRVEITKGNDEQAPAKLKIIYDLYQKTSQRKSISGRDIGYFEKLLSAMPDKITLAIAYFENIPLAGSLTILHGGIASYLYGGSGLEHKELMAPYLLHFEVMKYAKAQGCKVYDLLAIAPENKPNHHFANLTRFKQQFGGKSVELIGSYDLILKPTWYSIFKLLEKMRRK